MSRKPASEVTTVESKKRVAADGTQRGLARKGSKNKVTQLLEDIQSAVERDTGIKEWDPVVQMAVVAARAFSGYPATDDEGNPVIDTETGRQVMVPPDPALATAAAAKVAPYIHQQLRPKERGDEESDRDDPSEKRDKVLAAFESMGVEVNRDDE